MGEPMDIDLDLDEFMAKLRLSRNAQGSQPLREPAERAAAHPQATRHWTNAMVDSVLRSESLVATSNARRATPLPVTRSTTPPPMTQSATPAPMARSAKPTPAPHCTTPPSPSSRRPVYTPDPPPILSRLTTTQASRATPTRSRKMVLFPIPNSVRKTDLEAALEAKVGPVVRIELVGDVAIVYFRNADALQAANMFRNFAIDGCRLCAYAVPIIQPKPVRRATHAQGQPSVSSASVSRSPRRSEP